MTYEQLAPEKYPELIGVGPMTAATLPDPASSRIVVGRLGGRIAAYWVVQAVLHAEPIYVGPELEGLGRGKAIAELLPRMLAAVAACGDTTFYAFAADENVLQYALRIGLKPLPFTVFQGTIPPIPPTQETT